MRTRLPLVILFLVSLASSAEADVLLSYRGLVLTGPTAGATGHGTAVFPTGLPDSIPGGLEDWWQALTMATFT